MKFVFFGTAEFAVAPLQAIAPHVSLVVCQPPRPSGRGMKLQPSPVQAAAERAGLPVLTPDRARSPEFVERVREEHADALIVAAYGQILSVALLESAAHGGINLHGSILPKYRGAAPIQRCLLEGRSMTGVTLMQMDKGMDTGDMIDVAELAINADETYGELQGRLAEMAADLLERWAPRLAVGDYPRLPQDGSRATHAAKIERSDGLLDVRLPIGDVYNRFRAVTPSPGAFFALEEGPLRVLTCRRVVDMEAVPGQIVKRDGAWCLACQCGWLEIARVRPAGRSEMPFGDYLNGRRLASGDFLIA